MPKIKVRYVCQNCGSAQAKWMGKCPDCGEWNTLIEKQVVETPASAQRARSVMPVEGGAVPMSLPDISSDGFDRIPVEGSELSRVLGGGIVPGSVVLDQWRSGHRQKHLARCSSPPTWPAPWARSSTSAPRKARTKSRCAPAGWISTSRTCTSCPRSSWNRSWSTAASCSPRLIIVDSIQAIYTDTVASTAGSVSQVRDCASQLLRLAKSQGVPVFLVGHVTKEGNIAGPRVLEHMVDTVLYLEGERFQTYRLLRSVKNRFGSTDEVGVFEMVEAGMQEVTNPSEAFLAERLPNAAGSAIAVTMEGTRPLLVEVQALASTTSFSQPRRTANGVDLNRLLLLTAVLGKRVGFRLSDQDVFVNVVGGLQISEPAADLAIALAIASSIKNVPVPADLAVVGRGGVERRAAQRQPAAATDERGRQAGFHPAARASQPPRADHRAGGRRGHWCAYAATSPGCGAGGCGRTEATACETVG